MVPNAIERLLLDTIVSLEQITALSLSMIKRQGLQVREAEVRSSVQDLAITVREIMGGVFSIDFENHGYYTGREGLMVRGGTTFNAYNYDLTCARDVAMPFEVVLQFVRDLRQIVLKLGVSGRLGSSLWLNVRLGYEVEPPPASTADPRARLSDQDGSVTHAMAVGDTEA